MVGGSLAVVELMLLSQVFNVIPILSYGLTDQCAIFLILLIVSVQVELERDYIVYWKKHPDQAKAFGIWGKGQE
jgi:hypothetical protein